MSHPDTFVRWIPEIDPHPLRRLGRHVERDPRSRNFDIRATIGPDVTLAKPVLWTHHGSLLDQGQVGACTGNAETDAVMSDPNWYAGLALTETDALKCYGLATELDSIPGSYPAEDTGSSGLAACKAAVKLGWISSYLHAFSLTDALAALVMRPAMTGINWYSSFDRPSSGGLCSIRKGAVVRGGHEVCILGADPHTKRLRLINSWGPDWGDHGYFDLTFSTFGRLLEEQGDVTVPVR